MKVRFTVSIAALAWSANVDQVAELPAAGDDQAGSPTRAELLGFLESGIVVPVVEAPETAPTAAGSPETTTPPAAENAAAGAAPETGTKRRRASSSRP